MPCLMIGYVSPNGENKAGMRKYLTEGPAITEQYGGKYLVLGGDPLPLEGKVGWKAVVVSQWPDRDSFSRWYNSPEYTALRQHRAGTGDYEIVLVDMV